MNKNISPSGRERLCPALCLLLLLAAVTGCFLNSRNVTSSRHPVENAPAIAAAPAGINEEPIELAVRIFFRPLPGTMPGSQRDTPALVALGRKLYHEKGISLNKSQSCSECHPLDHGQPGADCKATSQGVKGIFGQRNSPTVLNAGFQLAQFWDGRAANLAEQAKGPILNPVEMAMTSPEAVVGHLKSVEEYRAGFALAYPDQTEPITYDNLANAIAAFERTLVAPARLDRYLNGETGVLSAREKKGLHLFTDTGCVECHSSHTVGGRLFEKLGVYHPYENQKDMGRYEVTRREEDRYVFKVPMLRNVTLTPPYFHDGQVSTLREAIRQMAWMQLNQELKPDEIEEIACFLKTLETERNFSAD